MIFYGTDKEPWRSWNGRVPLRPEDSKLVSDMPPELRDVALARGWVPAYRFYIPTERVIRNPEMAVPDQGRVWEYYPEDRNKSTGLLIELYSDYGNNGHTAFALCGYAYVTYEEIRGKGNRRLTFETWEDVSKFLDDMLVDHEKEG